MRSPGLAFLAPLSLLAVSGCGDNIVPEEPEGRHLANPAYDPAYIPDHPVAAPRIVGIAELAMVQQCCDEQTSITLMAFRQDGGMPRIRPIDRHCRAFDGLWSDYGKGRPTWGAVWVLGGEGGTIELTQGENYDGYWFPAGYQWATGDKLTVHADGGDLAPFSLGAEVPAHKPVLTSHDNTVTESNIHVVRDEGLALAWNPIVDDVRVTLVQHQLEDREPFHGVVCTFPGMLGNGWIPARAFEGFLISSRVQRTDLTVSAVQRTFETTDDSTLELAVGNGLRTRVYVE